MAMVYNDAERDAKEQYQQFFRPYITSIVLVLVARCSHGFSTARTMQLTAET